MRSKLPSKTACSRFDCPRPKRPRKSPSRSRSSSLRSSGTSNGNLKAHSIAHHPVPAGGRAAWPHGLLSADTQDRWPDRAIDRSSLPFILTPQPHRPGLRASIQLVVPVTASEARLAQDPSFLNVPRTDCSNPSSNGNSNRCLSPDRPVFLKRMALLVFFPQHCPLLLSYGIIGGLGGTWVLYWNTSGACTFSSGPIEETPSLSI